MLVSMVRNYMFFRCSVTSAFLRSHSRVLTPDISCAVHHCARHCANPKIQHTAAVKRVGRYLLGTKDKGLIMRPNQEGMECWVDAAHASEWNNKTASSDPNTARSRMGYVITYAGYPMHWTSKMQTEKAMSTTEAEYIALSQATREVLPIIWLMEEARHQGIPVLNAIPKIHCKVFEDNAGATEIANVPKMRPRTKHLTIKYHHFREEVKKGTISIYHTRTAEQIADIFTKPLPEQPFVKFREKMMGFRSHSFLKLLPVWLLHSLMVIHCVWVC